MTFPDHFSTVAAQYATSRPHYPDPLFAWLASQAQSRARAWDAGCGNGQASVGLAPHFTQVIATDASAQQIANAERRSNVLYAVHAEQNPDIEAGSVDLVTVAQALHWFDRTKFYAEVRRVLAPAGVFAVWTYEHARIDPATDAAVHAWYGGALDAYWPPERKHVETGYRDIGFPFVRIPAPAFDMSIDWTREQFVAYLRTWSAVKEYARRTGGDAMALVQPALRAAWPADTVRHVSWPLMMLAGRNRAGV